MENTETISVILNTATVCFSLVTIVLLCMMKGMNR